MLRFLICAALLSPALAGETWFVELQQENGSWDADAIPEELEGVVPGGVNDDVAVTALLTLAWLGDGDTSGRGLSPDRVARALGWLASQQDEEGRIGLKDHPLAMHHHALGALALSENFHFKSPPLHLEEVKKAVGYLEKTEREGGGWSASGAAGDPVDPVTTVWAVMLLRSWNDSKLVDSTEHAERAAHWFAGRCAKDTGLFRASEASEPDLKATACALVTRLLAGGRRELIPGLAATLDRVIEGRPTFAADPEYYYLTTVVAYREGGESWKKWIKVLKKAVLDVMQRQTEVFPVEPDAPVCGSYGATALGILCLEFFFRYACIVGAR